MANLWSQLLVNRKPVVEASLDDLIECADNK